MSFTTATRSPSLDRFWNFFASLTGGIERYFEDQRKRSVLAFFLLLGILIAFPFSIYHFSIGNITRAVIIFCVGSIQLANLVVLRYLKQAYLIFRLNVFLLGLYFIYLVFIGGSHGSRILWAFIFPLFTFYLLGSREGLFWSLLQGSIITILFLVPTEILESFAYSAEIKV